MKPEKPVYWFLATFLQLPKAYNLSILLLPLFILVFATELKAIATPVLPPVAFCRNIEAELGPGGTVTVTGAQLDAGSYDPDGTIVSMSVTPNTFDCTMTGPVTVTLTVTDNEGLSSSCNATVTVVDKMPPVMNCRNITLYLDESGQASLEASDLDNTSSDNCDDDLVLFVSRTEFNCSDIGSPVNVTLYASDSSGNTSSCSSQVIVADTVSPVINYKPFNVVLGASGTASVTPGDLDNGSFDNCGGVVLSLSQSTFTCADLGRKTITMTATDANGNTNSRDVVVEVSSTLGIAGMYLSSCSMSPSLALFEADVEGGDGSYSFLWKGIDPVSRPFMVITDLPPSLFLSNTSSIEPAFFNNTMPDGTYDIRLTVTDGNGCSDSSLIRINHAGAIFNNRTMMFSEACEGEARTYSVNYVDDATYSWSVVNGTILTTDQDTSRITVLWDLGVVNGTITTTIRDPNVLFAGGICESTVIDNVTIIPIPTPAFVDPSTDVCKNSESTYTLSVIYAFNTWNVTGGVITAGGKVTDNFVTVKWLGPAAGTVSVTAGNTMSCTGSVSLNVNIYNLTGRINSLSDISCSGGSDGEVSVSADAGTGLAPYFYSFDGGPFQSSGSFTGIDLGNHTVTIRDALLCLYEIPFTIKQPLPLRGTISGIKDITCFGESDGSVTFEAGGGTSPYQFSLDSGPFTVTGMFGSISPGEHTLTIRDANLCIHSIPFTINQPPSPLNVSVDSRVDALCYGEASGSMVVVGSGGTPPYEYSIDGGPFGSSGTFAGLASGNHTIAVRDANGCLYSTNEAISQPSTPLLVTSTHTDVVCVGGLTGSAQAVASGGTSPYTYAWNTIPVRTTASVSGLPAGSYLVTVTDDYGCESSAAVTISEPDEPLSVQLVRTDAQCNGSSDGSINLTVSNGTAPYSFLWNNGSGAEDLVNIPAGNYSVTVTDANGCTGTASAAIGQPAALTGAISVKSVGCFGQPQGSCDLTAGGGTPPYTYQWNNGSVTQDISGLTAGNYSVTVTDARGCDAVFSTVVTQPPAALSLSVVSVTDVTEYGGTDGRVTVAGAGGTLPYQYALNSGSYQASGTFASLEAGTYLVKVRDANMCTSELTVEITQPDLELSGRLVEKNDVSCNGLTDGSVTAEGVGGASPYMYSLDGSAFQASGTFGSLSVGSHTVTVRDTENDTYNVLFVITEPDAMVLTAEAEDATCYESSTGSMTVSVAGGTGPYTYYWNTTPAVMTATATQIPAGTYLVTVTDANGCSSDKSVTVGQPATDLVITLSKQDILCGGGATGTASVAVTGGLAPYSYEWDTSPVQGTASADGLTAGSYAVTVTDSYGCIREGSVTIGENQALVIEAEVVAASCPDEDDGSITLAVSGGEAPYSILWSDGTTLASRTNLLPGNYVVVVTDGNLCTEQLTVEVGSSYSYNCLIIPQVITPNNDGYNDEWRIRNIEMYPNAEVRIYNRWGKLVFSTRNLSDNPWDGRSDGKLVPTDSYHYILYLNDGTEPKTGVISVIR